MGRFATAVLLCTMLAVPSVVTNAQQVTIPAGTRVRVVFPAGASGEVPATRRERRVVGQLVGADDTSLVLLARRDSTEYRLPVHATVRLDVSDGRVGSNAGRGALVGLVVGGVIGFAIGVTAETECECPLGQGGAAGAVLGAGGLLIGAGIGWAIPRHRWRPVPLPVRVEPRAPR